MRSEDNQSLFPGKSHGIEEPGGLQSTGSQRVGHTRFSIKESQKSDIF